MLETLSVELNEKKCDCWNMYTEINFNLHERLA